MLDYAIEFLIANDVNEIFVLASAQHSYVEEHMERYKRIKLSKSVRLHTLVSEASMSAGDAMRDIDQRGVLENDFILVWGDLVANMDLSTALARHRERRAKDKSVIMTTVFQQMAPQTTLKSADEDVIVAVTPESRLLHYENDRTSKSVQLDMTLFQDHDAIRLRSDLVDTFVDICSPEVLICFTDNFDYQDIRRDLLRGILRDDILGSKVYAHVLPPSEFARRARNPRAYSVIGHALLQGWVHPVVPSANLTPHTSFAYRRKRIYREDEGVVLARSARCSNCALGAMTNVGEESVLTGCVIGRNCVIGSGSKLQNCILWDNVVVGDDVLIEDGCIIANDAKILSGATVSADSLIGPSVVVGSNFFVKPGHRLTALSEEAVQDIIDGLSADEGSSGEVDLSSSDATFVGADGLGRLYVPPTDDFAESSDDSDGDEDSQDLANLDKADDVNTGRNWCECGADHSMDHMEEEEETRRGSLDVDTQFNTEVSQTMARGIKKNIADSNLAVELNSLKMAYDRTQEDLGGSILRALLNLLNVDAGKAGLAEWQGLVEKGGPWVVKYVQAKDDQVELIFIIQEHIMEGNAPISHFPFILQILYEEDVLSEEAIMQWAEEQADGDAEEREYVTKAQPFLTWLAEAEEESDDDDDDDDESD
eukprot:TRINITY_DN6601_c0_g1_i2.p1 TRINITY_DN6601_c0_g1~~TRINITY_DN6601_c0_g1_i2.p1  ORF type:complete len:653 (-),score=120.90 TRINITY_DN6601_c0_g1_i2:167-2125(-)